MKEDALVVSAGPSAVGWKEIYKRILFEKPIVVCIKQSIELEGLDTLCDIHFINPYNLKKYKYITKPLVIFSDSTDAPNVYNKYDLRFLVKRDPGPPLLSSTVAFSGEFEKFELDKTGISRPWGPGIMYESVFYTLQHMGVTKIETIGWDIADKCGKNTHYYDQRSLFRINDSGLRRILEKIRIIHI